MNTHREIYLAGGCFWGMQAYFNNIQGVISTEVGYANGNMEHPTYEMVCRYDTGYAETIRVVYDNRIVDLSFLLQMYFKVIDPTLLNRQGNDIGTQYRTGIYYNNPNDLDIIQKELVKLQVDYQAPIMVECKTLRNYYPAEDYHQEYLKKNPNGYCHIAKKTIEDAKFTKKENYVKPKDEELKRKLTTLQYEVTQQNKTEPPFENTFWNHHEKGIYVDVTTGEPLFVSSEKFDSGCGWPSFAKPISKDLIKEIKDNRYGMRRIEVRSTIGDAHLGHVFDDGPKEMGGLRYCINSASLRFIPLQDMEKEGYGSYISLINTAS